MQKLSGIWKIICCNLLKVMAFLLTLLLLLTWTTEMLRNKTGDGHLLLSKELETQTEWDVIFAGGSRTDSSFYPMEMWRDYGFTAWNNGQSGEILPVSYYTCKNIVRRCHPKVLVVEISGVYLNRKYGNLTWAHESLDPISVQERIPAILDLIPQENKQEFLFPLALYHDRWNKLTKRDFIPSDVIYRGCSQSFEIAEDIADMELMDIPQEETLRPGDIPIEYLDKIVDLCQETGTSLLFVCVPGFLMEDPGGLSTTHDMSLEPLHANWVEEYAKEKGVDFINYIKLADQIGLDWWKHRYNYGHTNYWGGQIISKHIGQYLSENYNLPDRRTDPAYQNWNDDFAEYERLVEKNLLNVQLEAAEKGLQALKLPDLPTKVMISSAEYGDWIANQGMRLGRVNGEVREESDTITISTNAENIELYGWAVDFWNGAPLKELYLQVGDFIFKCEYGARMTVIEERYHIDAVNSGFEFTFPANLLKEDIREILFYGVSSDGKYLYEPITYVIEWTNQ